MKWRKLVSWLPAIPGYTHAACPTWYDGMIYFSPRKELSGRSNIFRASFDPKTLTLGTPELVALEGRMGQFDDAGRMVCCVTNTGIYYVGWNLGVTVPFRNALGRLGQEGPILDRSSHDLCMVASAWVDGEHLYYTSGESWSMRDNMRLEPQYRIKYGKIAPCGAISVVGWVCVSYANDWAITRPCVLPGRREMFYCYRGAQYRIGYAISEDGLTWKRRDSEVNLPLGEWQQFDDDAQCYPCVFDYEGSRYLLYNGNRYGETGFGIAILEKD